MSRQSFPIGAIDKNGVNVKTKNGWKGIVSHFKYVNKGLKENKRHQKRIKEIEASLA